MEILFRKELLEYNEPGHPESPQRLESIICFLEKKGRNNFLEFEEVSESLLEEVHSQKHISAVKKGNFFDPDTSSLPEIYRYAKLSAGGAVAAAKLTFDKKDAFALIRPPGHHAGRDFLGGFCYFNNIAIAVKYCLKSVKKVAILDLDGHHGNGTESIFRESKQVIFISIHQGHCYPWTGLMSFSNCYNFSVKRGTGFSDYKIFLFESIALINRFAPELVAISLGFDTHKNDPLLDLCFVDSDYYHLAKMIATGISVPCFFVLEGGYDVKSIGNSFYCFLSGWEKCRS
ncbi:MAG: histone deacetylase [Candidatus Omnitrophica bacterium]|nr:histone deacetylase [Candidatus Omnitrophota bacterium]